MLDTSTKKRIDDCRDILVGKLPDPKAQIEQITIGLIYKFMDDMDKEAIELGGKSKFFSNYTIPDPKDPSKKVVVEFEKYSWDNLFNTKVTASQMLALYSEAIASMDKNPNIPQLFRDIFKNAFLPYRDPETLKLFLKTIGEFEYTHSEKLGDAFEYLLSVMGSQGDAGQFRTPRHIIDFLVAIVDPNKSDTILDPACGTAGFLISAFKHIKEKNNNKLTPEERKRLIQNVVGYDISPDMVRLSLVNLYLHGFSDPHIWEYDTLSSEDRWNETYDVILANPPFMSPKGGIRPHKKFSISSNRSEVLFVDYIAEHLNPKGRAGIIVPEGVIFQSGTAYKELRKMLVEKYLYAVVSLPAGVFNPYSGVKTSILLMDREYAKKSDEILFVKIDNDGFGLGAQRNAVKGGQLDDAIEILKQFKNGTIDSQVERSRSLAHSVPKSEIAKNGDYNLSGDRYIKQVVINSVFELKKLKDLCSIMAGGTPSRVESKFWGGNIPWVGSTVCKNLVVTESEEFITELGLKNSSAKIFKSGTSLIALVGATIGKTGFLTFDCSTNQNVAGLYPLDISVLNPKYLFFSLQKLYPQFLSLGEGKFRMASVSFIRSLEIPLPPLSIQQEIVAEIEGYQKIIDGAKMVVENYQPKIDIDPEWEMEELGKLCKFIRGPFGGSLKKEIFVDKGFAVYEQSHAIYNQFKDFRYFIDEDKFNEMLRFEVFPNDIIMSCSGTMGKVAIVPSSAPKGVINQALLKLTVGNKLLPSFLKLWMESDNFQAQLNSNVYGAAIVNVASVSTLKELKIPLLPIEKQNKVIVQIEKEQELVNANKQLIELFEQKIKDRIARVWGEEKPNATEKLALAAEPEALYTTKKKK